MARIPTDVFRERRSIRQVADRNGNGLVARSTEWQGGDGFHGRPRLDRSGRLQAISTSNAVVLSRPLRTSDASTIRSAAASSTGRTTSSSRLAP